MGAVILGWLLVPVVIVGLLVLVLRLGRRAARAPEDLSVQRGKGWIRDDRPADIEYESVVDFRADSPGGGLLNPDPGYVAGRMRWRAAEKAAGRGGGSGSSSWRSSSRSATKPSGGR